MAKAPAPARRITPGPAFLSHYATHAIQSHMKAPAMPNSNGRPRMIVPCYQMWMVPALAMLLLTLTVSACAGGFPGGGRDALGPPSDTASQLRTASSPHSARGRADAMHQLRHWNEMAINASGLDQLFFPLPGRGRERPEPHLPRYPLGV